MGPVEYLLIAFPGNQFKGEIIPALDELVGSGLIHIIDLVFIKKDADGEVMILEMESLPEDEAAGFGDLDGDIEGLLSDEDLARAADALELNSSAALMLFEHVWATRFKDALVNAGGVLLDNGRIPAALVDEALALR